METHVVCVRGCCDLVYWPGDESEPTPGYYWHDYQSDRVSVTYPDQTSAEGAYERGTVSWLPS